MELVSAPDPTDAAADELHHGYAPVGSGDTGNKFVANQVRISSCQSDYSNALIRILHVTVMRSR